MPVEVDADGGGHVLPETERDRFPKLTLALYNILDSVLDLING